jgi:hypothetical protein
MVVIPSLTSMLLVLSVALVITVVASAAVGVLAGLLGRRRPEAATAPRTSRPAVPAQRTPVREPVSTH